jgi:ATP-dependent DNA helicase RecG
MRDVERGRGGGFRAPRPETLAGDIKYLPGVGPRKADLLQRVGLTTVEDLLHHFPRRYEDRRRLVPISRVGPGKAQVVHGEIRSARERSLWGGRSIIEVVLADPASGPAGAEIDLVWFNQPYLLQWLRPGARIHAFGQVRRRKGRLQMPAPEFEVDAGEEADGDDPSPHVGRIVPIYPLTRGLHQRFIRGLVFRVLAEDVEIPESPHDLFHPGGTSGLEALRRIHFPASWADLSAGRARLVFDEYFFFASHLHFRRQAFRGSGGRAFAITGELDRKIRSIFPFRFTAGQDRAVAEIASDLAGPAPMYRLLQGDVGTGKTAVALYAMLAAVRNRSQAALMAPTEILAEQHHRTIARALAGHPVRIALLTGSTRASERRAILEGLASGAVHLAVGTQALLQDGVEFRQLGLVVIDEQHRFGVKERMRLRRKGGEPHVLVMTATPIPRSLCLTSYGDLDLSILRERPQGRQPVKTRLISAKDRPRAMESIRGELERGRQAYFVYPLIDESEALALPAAVKAHERLSREVFPEWKVGLIHGDLPPARKDEELERFRRGDLHVLVATVVVEVGIDVPNATVLFIEDASRFGLAQLHQLRGRVGRGSHPGLCLVGIDSASPDVRRRLRVFASTDDGFRIAEEDLRLRGPGDFLGVRQSGKPHFLLGNPLENLAEFLRVKALAEDFWSRPGSEEHLGRWARELGGAPGPGEGDGFLGLD